MRQAACSAFVQYTKFIFLLYGVHAYGLGLISTTS